MRLCWIPQTVKKGIICKYVSFIYLSYLIGTCTGTKRNIENREYCFMRDHLSWGLAKVNIEHPPYSENKN